MVMDVNEIEDQVDLLEAFVGYDRFTAMMNNLLPALTNANSAAAAVLALEGLFRIEVNVGRKQFVADVYEDIRTFLRKWRCQSPLRIAYGDITIKFLRSLTIFKTLDVPLFIDNYGNRMLMSHYSDLAKQYNRNRSREVSTGLLKRTIKNLKIDPRNIDIENIPVDLDTPIVHVTHTKEKDKIVKNQKFKPSDRKNIIKGLWFSPKSQLGDPPCSVYGNWAFETTLRRLGVRGIHQGEIVSYKKEVNFILYASDTVPQSPVQKATDEAVKLAMEKGDAYAAVSIFVPWRLLSEETLEAIERALGQLDEQPDAQPDVLQLYQVLHKPFCVKQMRGNLVDCGDLD